MTAVALRTSVRARRLTVMGVLLCPMGVVEKEARDDDEG